jgi:ferrous iron transport protein B
MAEGKIAPRWGIDVAIADTPGTYSLFAKSYDEKIAVDSLYSHPEFGPTSLVVAVVDCNQLARHLYLVAQLKEAGFPMVVALTNTDVLHERGFGVRVDRLEEKWGCAFVPLNAQSGEGVADLISEMKRKHKSLGAEKSNPALRKLETWPKALAEKRFQQLSQWISANSIIEPHSAPRGRDAVERTRQWDRVVLHPFFGFVIFFTIMAALFTSIFWLAAPLMDVIDSSFGALAEWVAASIPHPLVSDFVANGGVAGVGAVLVFVPQIFILFLGIGWLEDSGYLARAASLVDRPLSKIGLNGRSFVPLLSGYACAIPAMMAARTINSRKEKLLTLFIIPLMSCSARLPVYALFLAYLFRDAPAWMGGVALAVIYFASFVVGAIFSGIASRLLKIQESSFFLLELPLYRRPLLRATLRSSFNRVQSYVMKAGPIIFALSLVIWGACTFPHYKIEDPSERLAQSYAADLGRFIEPAMEPMGADWRVGIGLISAFAAREVFVSSLAVIFRITAEDDEGIQEGLLATMDEAVNAKGEKIFDSATVVGLIFFFMVALQCMATFGVARREFGSWRWAVLQLVAFNLAAYGGAVVIVQSMRALGFT